MSDELNIFRDYLTRKRLKKTPQREAVLKAFLKMEGHFLVEDLYEVLREENIQVGIATVYRTVRLLTDCGLARENRVSHGKATFEQLFLRGHHDHLICIQCGRVVEFEHPVIRQLQWEVSRLCGFAMEYHRMELSGLCSECQD